MKFSLIAAVDSKNGIGAKNTLVWKIPEDLEYFNKMTTGNGKNIVIMGKNTWESLPEKFRPLPRRTNFVLTRNADYKAKGGIVASSLEDALERARSHHPEHVFVIGGAQVYAEAIKHGECEKIYLTHVEGDFNCDAFFPKIDETVFEKVFESKPRRENGITYRFAKYVRGLARI